MASSTSPVARTADAFSGPPERELAAVRAAAEGERLAAAEDLEAARAEAAQAKKGGAAAARKSGRELAAVRAAAEAERLAAAEGLEAARAEVARMKAGGAAAARKIVREVKGAADARRAAEEARTAQAAAERETRGWRDAATRDKNRADFFAGRVCGAVADRDAACKRAAALEAENGTLRSAGGAPPAARAPSAAEARFETAWREMQGRLDAQAAVAAEMRAAAAARGREVRALAEAVACPICFGPMRVPVTVPEGHSYCRKCLADAWAADGESETRNPLTGSVVPGGMDSTVRNIALEGVVDALEAL